MRIEDDNLLSTSIFHLVKQTKDNPTCMLAEKSIFQLLKMIIVNEQ